MRRSLTLILVSALGAAGCGLSAAEQALLDGTECPALEAAAGTDVEEVDAPLVIVGVPGESYFVDSCHRAYVVEVQRFLEGRVAEPILVILPVSGSEDPWAGRRWLLALEPDQEIADLYRPAPALPLPVRVGEAGLRSDGEMRSP